jgi:hypothetical protein
VIKMHQSVSIHRKPFSVEAHKGGRRWLGGWAGRC